MDIIFLHEYKLDLVIGVYAWERHLPQTVQLDLEIGLPESATRSTDLAGTIDYGAVVQAIEASVTQQHFELLETLAEHIAQLIREDFKAPWVRVTLTKLGMMSKIKHVGISIARGTPA